MIETILVFTISIIGFGVWFSKNNNVFVSMAASVFFSVILTELYVRMMYSREDSFISMIVG